MGEKDPCSFTVGILCRKTLPLLGYAVDVSYAWITVLCKVALEIPRQRRFSLWEWELYNLLSLLPSRNTRKEYSGQFSWDMSFQKSIGSFHKID